MHLFTTDFQFLALVTVLIAQSIIIVILMWPFKSNRRIYKLPINPTHQSKIANGNARKSVYYPTKSIDECIEYYFDDAKTLSDCLHRGAKISGNGPCLGKYNSENNQYEWISYEEVIDRANKFGSGLIKLGLSHGEKIGIFSLNCAEYTICEYGCYFYGFITVPLYHTLTPSTLAYIANHTKIKCIIIDNEDRVNEVLSLYGQLLNLKYLVVINSILESYMSKAKGYGLMPHSMSSVMQLGNQHPSPLKEINPDDIALICFTSGTEGYPKGVILTHKSIMANIAAVMYQLGNHIPKKEDILLSFLPLAHMLERNCEAGMLMVGGQIGYFRGDLTKLVEDMKILKPTLVPCVPRLLHKIYTTVQLSLNRFPCQEWIFNRLLASKIRQLSNNESYDGLIDKLIFNKIRKNFGGKIRLLVVGAAPTAPNIINFIRCVLGCTVCEGYGQTECVCACTLTLPDDTSTGHVGPPLPSNYIKLIDVPSMDYWAKENKGEICVKGSSIFSGYYNDKDKTKDAIDEDGWVRTGDVGQWNNEGTLTIIDRCRDIIKLSQGEFVSPEKIECAYISCKYVSQIFVCGDRYKSSVVAIVIPNPDTLLQWARKQRIQLAFTDLCNDERTRKMILENLNAIGKKHNLKGYEQVKDIRLHPEPLTIENGLMTPTCKTRRSECRKHYSKLIQEMYKAID